MRVGVISDTHSLLRPSVLDALEGVEQILHAGDVGDIGILGQLLEIAPVTAIRGNVDRSGRCAALPEVEWVTLGDVHIYMLHDVKALDMDPAAAGIDAVISGHSHAPLIEWREQAGKPRVLFFNPGSVGPRRFSLPISLGFLEIRGGTIEPELVEL